MRFYFDYIMRYSHAKTCVNNKHCGFVRFYSLYETIESLESRCEDLQHLVDDMGHLKKDDSVVTEGSVSGSAIEDQDEYAKLVSQLEHAKNQRAKEQRKVSELEQNVSLLIQV